MFRFPPGVWLLCATALVTACTHSAERPGDATDATESSNPAERMRAVSPATTLSGPEPDAPAHGYTAEEVRTGRYLVGLLGCGSCHTHGALTGTPDPALRLAGSRIGIAYSNPMEASLPGIVFPSNLTPHETTGIGRWSEDEIVRVLREGIDRDGRRHLPVMPWPAYARLSDADARAIAAYLRSLPPVRHRVPHNVAPGEATDERYVHFGVYLAPGP